MAVGRYDCTSGGAQWCHGCYQMTKDKLGDYVNYEDYEKLRQRIAALEAENAELRLKLRNGLDIDWAEEVGNE